MVMAQFIHKNQFVIVEDEGRVLTFKSYKSRCCSVNNERKTIILGRDWDYSNTTLRHLYEFIDMFVPCLHRKTYIEKCIKAGKIGKYELIYDENMK